MEYEVLDKKLFGRGNSAELLLGELRKRFTPEQLARDERAKLLWDSAGVILTENSRFHEALALSWGMYKHMLAAQPSIGYVALSCKPAKASLLGKGWAMGASTYI